MKISVSSYSFQQYINAGKLTQLSAIAAAKDIGLEAIEFIDLAPTDGMTEEEYAVALREEAKRLGMIINAYTISANLFRETAEEEAAEIARLKKKVDVAALLGAKVMRHDVAWGLTKKGAGRSFDTMLPRLARCAREITEYAETKGIRTCSENHGLLAQDSDRVERLVNAVNHDNYGLLVDMGNFACADEDSAIAVSRVAPYAVHAHAKDFVKRTFAQGPIPGGCFQSRGCNYLRGVAVGMGDIPVKQCIAILKRAGYDGYLSIEYEGYEDCIEGITTGFKNLTKFLAELA